MKVTLKFSSPSNTRKIYDRYGNPLPEDKREFRVRVIPYDENGKVIPPKIRSKFKVLSWTISDPNGTLETNPKDPTIASYLYCTMRTNDAYLTVKIKVKTNGQVVSQCAKWFVPNSSEHMGQEPC